MPNGTLVTCEGEDFDRERKLQLPRQGKEERTGVSLPTQAPPFISPRHKLLLILSPLLLFLIGGGPGRYVTDTAQAWKDVKLDEQSQPIRKLQAQIHETKLLLQQKETPTPARIRPEDNFRETKAPMGTEFFSVRDKFCGGIDRIPVG